MGLSILYPEAEVRAVISPVHFVEEEKNGEKERGTEGGRKEDRKKEANAK